MRFADLHVKEWHILYIVCFRGCVDWKVCLQIRWWRHVRHCGWWQGEIVGIVVEMFGGLAIVWWLDSFVLLRVSSMSMICSLVGFRLARTRALCSVGCFIVTNLGVMKLSSW